MNKELDELIKDKIALFDKIAEHRSVEIATAIFREVCIDERKLREAEKAKTLVKDFQKIFKSMGKPDEQA